MLFGVGCTPNEEGKGGDEALAEITVSPTSFATDLEGGEQVITVTSNATWAVSCDQADVTIEPLTGNGNGSVTITVPAAAAREFKVVFDAQKQTSIPALGTSTTTTAKAEVTVSQNNGGVNLDDYLFYENCGEDVEKNSSGYWPYVYDFEGWNPQGDAAVGVTYNGAQASVRASGNAYQPTADAVGISGQPYVFLNKVPAQAYFVIENIAVTGGTNYIFTYNAQCQSGYSSSPTFATVDGSLIHLELGYDGQTWDAVDCTYAPNGGNGWYAVQTEFKVKADATKLYARFTYEAPASNGGGRFDDFKLVAGGNGAELNPEAPVVAETTIADITAAGNYTVKNAWAVATYDKGCLLTDASGKYILAYNPTTTPAVGEKVTIDGSVSAYAGLLQFGAGATITKTGETVTVSLPTPEVLDAAKFDALAGALQIKYVEYEGALTIDGSYYNITIAGATNKAGVQYPAGDIKTTLDGLNGKYVKVTGFTIGYTSSKSILQTMATAVVETTAPEGGETPEPEQPGEGGGETPDTPATGDYTKIEKVANLVAGDYIVAGYLTSYTSGSNSYDWTNYPYHFWTGTISSKNDLNTVNGNESMVLDPNMSAQDAAKGQPATITFVAVDGKANTYYIKVGDKYLYNKTSATNRSLGLGDTQVEWVVSDHSKGGLVLATDGVQAGTAGATYDLIRSYKDSSAGSSLKYGLVFFKKN